MITRTFAVTAVIATATLTACGTTEDATGGGSSATSPSRSSSAGPVTMTDATGAKVALKGPATKVVSLEWGLTEDLIKLGVTPTGIADMKGYRAWDTVVPVKGSSKDVGTRGEPSTDTIAGLAPDLIVTTTDLPAAAVKQLRKIGPTLVIAGAKGTDQMGQMKSVLDTLARATGTTSRATAVWNHFTAALASDKKKLAAAGMAGKPVAFADGYVEGSQVTIRPYTKTSQIGAVNAALGLKDVWTTKGDPAYGLGTTDVEGLTKLPAGTEFAYIQNDIDRSASVFTSNLAKNAVWTSLSFVKAGAINRLPDGIWMFGGPASLQAYSAAITTALTK